MFNYFKNRKLIKNASDTLFIKMNEYARNPIFFGDNRVEDDPDCLLYTSVQSSGGSTWYHVHSNRFNIDGWVDARSVKQVEN